MSSPQFELADAIRQFGDAYKEQYGDRMLPSHHRVLSDIANCMTPEMGGGRYRCKDCNEDFWQYHGCRNRSCPKCHGKQTADWLTARKAEVLPCQYFHVVATVPSELRALFLRHQKILYGLLMRVVTASLRELAAEKRFVGAEVGILAVLHTWTAMLMNHPHVHMLVTGGGISRDGTTWSDAPKDFLVPVKRLSPMISKRFSDELKKLHPELHAQVPAKTWKREWCSFCKPYGTGKDAVLRYLARYVFRVAICNARIVNVDESHVTFRYKDNETGNWETGRLLGVEFIRRFLMHVLPKGFHKVRYYGLWAPVKKDLQAQTRYLLLATTALRGDGEYTGQPALIADLSEEVAEPGEQPVSPRMPKCPSCGSSNVVLIEDIPRGGRRTMT